MEQQKGLLGFSSQQTRQHLQCYPSGLDGQSPSNVLPAMVWAGQEALSSDLKEGLAAILTHWLFGQ